MQVHPDGENTKKYAPFVGLTSYCYRHLCIKMHQNMSFPDERKTKNFLGGGSIGRGTGQFVDLV